MYILRGCGPAGAGRVRRGVPDSASLGGDARIQHRTSGGCPNSGARKRVIGARLRFFSRCNLALALALLIAQPIMPMPGSGVNVAVILDASASMQMADGSGQTRFARRWRRRSATWTGAMGRERDGGAGRDEARCGGSRQRRRGASRGAGRRFVRLGRGRRGGRRGGCASRCSTRRHFGRRLYTDAPSGGGAGGCLLRGGDECVTGALETSGSIYGTAFETTVQSFGRSADVSFELIVDGSAARAEKSNCA